MGKIPKKILKWRKKQKRGSIMKTTKFNQIAKATNTSIAGKIYWDAVKAKYKKRKKR
jgi:hypothetical protein